MQTQNSLATDHRQNDAAPTFPVAEPSPARPDRELTFARGLFCLLIVWHLWAVSVGWKSGLLQGNEFRQTQTAITTLFVQREQNFSLAYPTPVLGKPWSVPMEFPLYQWTVSLVSSATGLPLTQAARAVSCCCFYLSLPAVGLLLRRLRLTPTQRWVTLGVMLTCPLYIFYARAFLIETMALMFSLWFVQSFCAAVEQRSAFWLVVANVAGIGAGLVKVTTLMLYLVPVGCFAAALLWRRLQSASGTFQIGPRFWRVAGWIVGCVLAPAIATVAWIKVADAVKALNPSGQQLISSSMSGYHFGTWQTRLASETWLHHWHTLTTNIAPWPVLALTTAVAAGWGGRWRNWILGTALLFAAAPLTFPILYALHEYYWVANTVLLTAAIGFAFAGLLESTVPRGAIWAVILGLQGLQGWAYVHFLYPTQQLPHAGGSGLTRLLRDVTDPQDVLLIAGNDWSSVIPFYAERRALMIRTHLEKDEGYLDRAFNGLADESVPVLILVGEQRNNRAFLERAIRSFDFDPAPYLVHKDQTVYVSRSWRKEYTQRLFNVSYNDVAFVNRAEQQMSNQPLLVSAMRTTQFFQRIIPRPDRYQVPFGLTFGFRPNGNLVFDAHAPSRLWFKLRAGTQRLSLEYGLTELAYTREGDRTDGVEFVVVERRRDGTERVIFSRLLDPVHQPADRGTQRTELSAVIDDDAEVVAETRPGPSGINAFDWSYWQKIEFR